MEDEPDGDRAPAGNRLGAEHPGDRDLRLPRVEGTQPALQLASKARAG
jgi:hypothetical protein